MRAATGTTTMMMMPQPETLRLPPMLGSLPPKGQFNYTLRNGLSIATQPPMQLQAAASGSPSESTKSSLSPDIEKYRHCHHLPCSPAPSPDCDGPKPSASQSSTPRVLPFTPRGVPCTPTTTISSLQDPQRAPPPPLLEPSSTTTTASTPSAAASSASTPRVIPHAPRLMNRRGFVHGGSAPTRQFSRLIDGECCTDYIWRVQSDVVRTAVYTAMAERDAENSPVLDLEASKRSSVSMQSGVYALVAPMHASGHYHGGGWV